MFLQDRIEDVFAKNTFGDYELDDEEMQDFHSGLIYRTQEVYDFTPLKDRIKNYFSSKKLALIPLINYKSIMEKCMITLSEKNIDQGYAEATAEAFPAAKDMIDAIATDPIDFALELCDIMDGKYDIDHFKFSSMAKRITSECQESADWNLYFSTYMRLLYPNLVELGDRYEKRLRISGDIIALI